MENTRYKVLLVEDDRLDQMAFKKLVETKELPYDCAIAGSVSEAKSILGSEQFDIIVADHLLGDGTAFDIFEAAKDTPVIFVTGAGDEEVAVEAWKAGAYDYLIKDRERNYLKVLPVRVDNVVKHKRTEEKLKQYNRLKRELALTVSQEFRTSLRIFKNIISNAIAEKLGPISDKLRKNLEAGDRTVDRLAKIIGDFLDISKIETGKIQMRKTKVDIHQVISEAIFLLTDLAAEKKIKLLAAFAPDPGFTIYADHGLLRQALVNLIDNAIKFSPMGVTIRVTVRNLKDEVQINIQDTSIGIGSEDISKVFNSFVQSGEYNAPGSHGTGLGVYVAKQLIETQGGRIWAENSPGQGSTFCFTLPKSIEQEAAVSATITM